jgi:hypothetical protein
MAAILVTNYDDWEALYIDGKCVAQDHKLNWKLLRSVKGKLFEQGIDNEYTYEVGQLPDEYDNIPKGAFMDDPLEVRVDDE